MRLAVIIPVYNNASMLAQTLASIRAGSRAPDELLVVDDASTDNSAAVALAAGAAVLAMRRNAGPAACRNFAAQAAQADLLIFLDADTVVHADTLSTMEERMLADPTLTAVIGSYDDRPPAPGYISQFRNLSHHFVHSRSAGNSLSFWSGCGAIRREAFLQAGGFNVRYRHPSIEDIELGYRLSSAGQRILLDPTVTVTHLKHWSLLSSVRTDVLDRGAPWVCLLIARGRGMPDHLNISLPYRLSTALTACGWILLLSAFSKPALGLLAIPCFAAAVVLHWQLLRFLSRARGKAFLLASVPLHLLQQSSNLAALLVGLVQSTLGFCARTRRVTGAAPMETASTLAVPQARSQHRQ
jgi:glycosyltransferase involved in cell wall biosynthesis